MVVVVVSATRHPFAVACEDKPEIGMRRGEVLLGGPTVTAGCCHPGVPPSPTIATTTTTFTTTTTINIIENKMKLVESAHGAVGFESYARNAAQ